MAETKTQVPEISANIRWRPITQIWETLATGDIAKTEVGKALAKKLFWVSVNVIVNGRGLYAMWKFASVKASNYLSVEEMEQVAEDIEPIVNVFLQTLYYAELIDTTPPAKIAKISDPVVQGVKIAWGFRFKGVFRYIVLKITPMGVSATIAQNFRGENASFSSDIKRFFENAFRH